MTALEKLESVRAAFEAAALAYADAVREYLGKPIASKVE